MIKHWFWVLFLVVALNTSAQKFVAERGVITFFSDAVIEDIKAENAKVSSIFNTETNDIAFSVPIREFQFEKKLMQQHFNEKYMDSDKFPKATFSGKIEGYDKSGSGNQEVKAVGKLTIHGVTQSVTIPGTISTKDSKMIMKSKFIVKLADYKIDIPQLMWQNIAEQVEVTVDITYKSQ
jgi:hypothetical protein